MIKHTNRIVLAAALWAAVSIPAQAQVVCAERLQVTEHLAQNFREKPAGTGLTHAGQAIELFVAETGTWTIVIVTPAGEACIVSHGEAWQAQPSGARRGARWSS